METQGILKYIKDYLGTDSNMEVQDIKELIDGSLNVTVKSDNPDFDGKCYYINWQELYEILGFNGNNEE